MLNLGNLSSCKNCDKDRNLSRNSGTGMSTPSSYQPEVSRPHAEIRTLHGRSLHTQTSNIEAFSF